MRHYLHNPRRITNAQMARLKTTLAELGDLGGVIVNVETQEIVGGNQRVKAMNAYNAPITITQTFDPPTPQGTVALGYIEHAGERFAYRAVKWTSEQCQRANIVANAAGGSWDWDLLASEFPAELLVSSGLDADALAAMQTDADALGKMLAVEPVAETADAGELELHLAPKRVSLGEIWQLGRHRIACIDSTDEGQVARLLGGAKPTFVWCDPPYGIGLLDTVGKVGHSRNYMPVIGDKNTKTARDAVAKFLPMGGLQVWWGANYYADSFPPSPCWIVFDKDHYGMTFADAELAWVSDNSPARCFRHAWSGADRDSEKGEGRVHPNQKPVALAAWCFEKYGKPNDIILDGFLGSGISVLAAEQMSDGRIVYGADLAPEYCDWTIARWEKATGLEARLLT